MTTYNRGLHHYHIRRRIYKKYEPYPHPHKFKRLYDKVIYGTIIICVIFNILQLFRVWIEKNASGVSSISWFGFSFVSLMWLIYGILHKDKHILIMNASLVVIQILIAIGAIIYN